MAVKISLLNSSLSHSKELAAKVPHIAGELSFVNNMELHIPVEFEDWKPALIQLDTGPINGSKDWTHSASPSWLGCNGSIRFDDRSYAGYIYSRNKSYY